MNIPKHIGFIMDGNGRWAQKRLLPRNFGHKKGVDALKRVVNACIDEGVGVVSMFAFSSENWARPKSETDYLFGIIWEFVNRDLNREFSVPVRLVVMGDLGGLPEDVRKIICEKMKETAQNTQFVLNIGINYGGRDEIIHACNLAIKAGKEVDAASFEKYLYTAGLPEPDVIVRTSGEMRLSNFMLYQCAYSELIFLKKLWPDMDASDVREIIREYSGRNRKFGAISEE